MKRWRRSPAAQAFVDEFLARWELADYSARLAEAYLAARRRQAAA